MFEKLLGNDSIKSYLTNAVRTQSVPHALLFTGPDGVGKSLFAKELGAALLRAPLERILQGIHPDFHVLHPEGKAALHAIENIRELIDQVQVAGFETSMKVFLIESAEKMQPASANALLKTLEEPSVDTTIILLSSSPKNLLPTIVSRCVQLNFQLVSITEKKEVDISFLEAMFDQGVSLAEKFAKLESLEERIQDEDPVQERRKGEALFKSLLMWVRDLHAKKVGVQEKLLFYPESVGRGGGLPDFEKFHKKLHACYLAYQRNIKLSVCFKQLFL